jgi:hypothetical protein
VPHRCGPGTEAHGSSGAAPSTRRSCPRWLLLADVWTCPAIDADQERANDRTSPSEQGRCPFDPTVTDGGYPSPRWSKVAWSRPGRAEIVPGTAAAGLSTLVFGLRYRPVGPRQPSYAPTRALALAAKCQALVVGPRHP